VQLAAALGVPESAVNSVSVYSGSIIVQVCFDSDSGVDLSGLSFVAADINSGNSTLLLNATGDRGELILVPSGAGVQTACSPAPTTAPTGTPPFCARDDPILCADVVTTDCADGGLRGVCQSLCGVCLAGSSTTEAATTFPIFTVATTNRPNIDDSSGASSGDEGYDTLGIFGWITLGVLLVVLMLYLFCKCCRRQRTRRKASFEQETISPFELSTGRAPIARRTRSDSLARVHSQTWDDFGDEVNAPPQSADPPNVGGGTIMRHPSRSSNRSNPLIRRNSIGGMSMVSDVAWDHYEVHHAVYRAKRHRRSLSSASHSSTDGQGPVDKSWSMEPGISPTSRQTSSASVSPDGAGPPRDGSGDSEEPKGFYEAAPDLSEVVSAQASALSWVSGSSQDNSSSDGEGGGTGASALSVASAPEGLRNVHEQQRRPPRMSSSGASDMSAVLRFASAVSADELFSLEKDIQTALAEEGVRLSVASDEGSVSSPTRTTTEPSDVSSPRLQGGRLPMSRRSPSKSSLRSQSWTDIDGSRSA